jgi:hypothetical protein
VEPVGRGEEGGEEVGEGMREGRGEVVEQSFVGGREVVGPTEGEGQAAGELGGDAGVLEKPDGGVVAAADGGVAAEELQVAAGEEVGRGGGGEVEGNEKGRDGGGRRPVVGLMGEPAVENELGGRAGVGSESLAADEAGGGGEEGASRQALDVVAEVEVATGVGEEGRQGEGEISENRG